MMHCVIIEWGDGTVSPNGPYESQEQARQAAMYLATSLASEDERSIEQRGDDLWTIGDDAEDQIDVYASEMGEPVKIASDG